MPAVFSTDAASGVATIEVEGEITSEDFDRILPEIEDFIEAQGKIRLIEIIHSFKGISAGMLWEGIKADFRTIPNISHCAVVSDIGWMTPLAKAAGAVISTKLRTFSMAELDEAKAWIANPDG